MENGKDQKMPCEMKTDLNLLLECLKYQMDHPTTQKEALVTIYSACQQNSDASDYFREIGGLMFVYNLAKSSVHSMVKEAAFFTLGGLAENNVFCQQALCTSGSFEDLHRHLTNNDSSVNLKRMSVYFLIALVSNNKRGQMCAKESGCLNALLQLFRTSLSVCDLNLLDQKINEYHLWSSICSALCASVNNPQNEENQKFCSSVFPHAKDWLQSSITPEIVRPVCSFIGLTVANNSRMQQFFVSVGGLAVLDELLVKLRQNSVASTKLAIVVTKTIDACIADNLAVGINLPRYNIVPNLLTLLSYKHLDPGEKNSIILTLGHCTYGCEENQFALVKNNGLPLMIQALTESQDEELNKAVTFVLQNCKQITEKLSLKLGKHSLKLDDAEQLKVDWQNKEMILEDYWDKAKEILYRIEGLENDRQQKKVRRQILIDYIPKEVILQTTPMHLKENASKPNSSDITYTEVNQQLLDSMSTKLIATKFVKDYSKNELLKPANRNPIDASVSRNELNLHAADKMRTPNISYQHKHITDKNTVCESSKSEVQVRYCIYDPTYNFKLILLNPDYPLCSRTTSRRINCNLAASKIAELQCTGCITVGIPLNSRNCSKILQSCKYLCEQHKVTLETELKYKRKIKRSIISSRNTSTEYNADLQTKQDAYSKKQIIQQKHRLKHQDLNEDHAFSFKDGKTDIHLQDIPAATFENSKRRTRKNFTSEEIRFLLDGVKKMGHHWNLILWTYPFQKGRTNVDLAKKYYHLQKNKNKKNI
ncbi:telomere repeats-binding bouquet formation protein 1 [Zootoca vivipara]|uniref:telomere repeats-binding bouquet formation protein 1 n=1 Tax=Zootoca vivipara TaxID=8524 RepID=UPI00293BA899|nr:telomere repeats-binding bouquet formation protein 1 [Zootoca vivipara]